MLYIVPWQVGVKAKKSKYVNKSMEEDMNVLLTHLRSLKPIRVCEGRQLELFIGIITLMKMLILPPRLSCCPAAEHRRQGQLFACKLGLAAEV